MTKHQYTLSEGTYRDPSADRIVMLETESVINGWRVRTRYIQTSPEDAKARRDLVARLIARSILEREQKRVE